MATDVDGLKAAALAHYEDAFQQVADSLLNDLRAAAPRNRGTLYNAIQVTVDRKSETVFGLTAEADVIQALTTDQGARPHLIQARGGRVLAFMSARAGKMVFVKSVQHPGNVGTHWWSNIMDRISERIAQAVTS